MCNKTRFALLKFPVSVDTKCFSYRCILLTDWSADGSMELNCVLFESFWTLSHTCDVRFGIPCGKLRRQCKRSVEAPYAFVLHAHVTVLTAVCWSGLGMASLLSTLSVHSKLSGQYMNPLSQSLSLSVYISVSVCLCESMSVSFCLCLPLSVSLFVYLYLYLYLSVSACLFLPRCLCPCLSVCLSVCLPLSVCLSPFCVCVSACLLSLSVCLSVCLSRKLVRYAWFVMLKCNTTFGTISGTNHIPGQVGTHTPPILRGLTNSTVCILTYCKANRQIHGMAF